ncbi:MAG: hypothetical protein GSR86_07120 [Desulfurococcales archaeon]|nr:hypothetical protein [Desulfurococcales archaeon]
MKYQEASVTPGSRYLAVLYRLVDVLETRLAEYYDPREVLVDETSVSLENVMRGDRVRLIIYNIGEEGVIDEYQLKDAGTSIVIEARGTSYTGIGYEDLLEIISRAPFRLDKDLIRSLAINTSRSGIEYMLLYTESGLNLRLEGEHLRVRIPFVKTIASIHTHPEGACGLSKADLASGLDLLVEGGVLEASATPTCGFLMYRRGFIDEDDYIAVKTWRGEVLRDVALKSIVFKRIYY